jgi:predicted ATPase
MASDSRMAPKCRQIIEQERKQTRGLLPLQDAEILHKNTVRAQVRKHGFTAQQKVIQFAKSCSSHKRETANSTYRRTVVGTA